MAMHTIDRIVDANGNVFVLSDSSKAEASTASPLMDGKASVGNSLKYAREDHVHPADTSREDIANKTTVVLGTSDSKYPTDKAVANFVNSSIATNTANYISNNGEPFTSVEQLEAYTGAVTNNDYAFVTGIDSEGNTYYDRYKATVSGETVTWALEYRLNNSSFTAAQWSAINSGITSVLVAKIHEHSNKDVLDGITSSDVANWNSKANAFDILPTTKGGTGTNAANQEQLLNTLINTLTVGTGTPVDGDYYVGQYGGGGTHNTTYRRRTLLSLWNYIIRKISSVLGLTATNYSGKAATAGTADKAVADNSGNDIETTYATKSELSTHTSDTTVHITAEERKAWNAKADLVKSVAIFDGYVRRMNESTGWRRVAYKQFNGTATNINALFRLYLIGSNTDHIGLGDLFVNIRFNSSGSAPEFVACYLMSHRPLKTSIKLKVVGVAGNAVVEVWFRPPTFSMLMLSCLGNGSDVNAKAKDWTFEKYLDATDPEPIEDTANHVYVFSGTVRSVQLNIASPTNNNLVAMDANGLVKDSGLAKSSVESAISKAGSAIQGVKVNNTTLTPDANKIVNVPLVTTSADGAMSAADKTKLDGIAAGTASPLMDGKASVGNSLKYAREDHVHPTDTSRASASHTHGSITNDGKIGTTENIPVITGTGGAVTTGSFSTTTSEVATSSAAGNANTFSRGDHVHSISLDTGDSDGQVKIAGINVNVAGWGNKASQFSLGTTAGSRVYTMFARMPEANYIGNIEAQFILSSAGNYGQFNQGTWEIIVSNRGSTASSPKAYMTVLRINEVQAKSDEYTEPTFGYYIDTTNHYIYFGMYSPAYRGESRITVLVNNDVTLKDFGDSTDAPTGWTTVKTTGVSSAVKLDTARTIQTDLASTSSASFDGTANIKPGVTGTLPVTNGGTGATTPAGAQFNLIDKATTELGPMMDAYRIAIMSLNPSATDSVISGYRTGLTMWEYMKGKMSSDTGVNISGKAATAGAADKAVADNSGNNIEETYATKTELDAAIGTGNAKGLTIKEISGEQVICFE